MFVNLSVVQQLIIQLTLGIIQVVIENMTLRLLHSWNSSWAGSLDDHDPRNLQEAPGSTIRTFLHGKINPKDWQVLSLGDVGFLLCFRVVSGDYGKPRAPTLLDITRPRKALAKYCHSFYTLILSSKSLYLHLIAELQSPLLFHDS